MILFGFHEDSKLQQEVTLLPSILFLLNYLKGFWKHQNNQRAYMDWLGKKLGFSKMEDWYNITRKDFRENNGVTLLNLYQNSPQKIIQAGISIRLTTKNSVMNTQVFNM